MKSVRILFSALLVLAAEAAVAEGPKGAMYTITTPKPANMVAAPAFYAWTPEGAGPYRSIIVHQHGCTREGDAQMMMNDVQWKSLAKKWHAVFVAPKFTTGSVCGNWNDIKNGSGEAFLAMLDTLARRTGHAEIKTVPWALWGHSGGSMWSTAMAGKYPERVAVVVAQACASEISQVDAALKIPILHHNGKSDLCYNDAYFAHGRARGALWAHAVNPFVTWVYNPNKDPLTMMGHAPEELRMIAIDWMDIALTERLPDAGQAALRDMDTTAAWLGDTATRAIASAAAFSGDKLKACWFPNRHFAEKWREYMATGRIEDSLPPPAPFNLAGTFANKRITLNWDADADLETGIKTFLVYRNGTLLDTLRYPNMPQTHFTMEKGYQRWNDGDQPLPSPAPAMTFTDAAVTDTGTYVYQVSLINWAGVAGPKSDGLTLKRGQVTGIGNSARSGSAAAGGRTTEHKRLFLGGDMRIFGTKLSREAGAEAVYDARGALIFRTGGTEP